MLCLINKCVWRLYSVYSYNNVLKFLFADPDKFVHEVVGLFNPLEYLTIELNIVIYLLKDVIQEFVHIIVKLRYCLLEYHLISVTLLENLEKILKTYIKVFTINLEFFVTVVLD